jgi:ABC-type sugar transport system ATPase subunit
MQPARSDFQADEVTYGKLLRGVNFTLRYGEVLGILGSMIGESIAGRRPFRRGGI